MPRSTNREQICIAYKNGGARFSFVSGYRKAETAYDATVGQKAMHFYLDFNFSIRKYKIEIASRYRNR